MKNSAFSARKSWRDYRRRDRRRAFDALVRRFCYGAILLEAALLFSRYGGEDFFALRTESESRQWVSPAEDGSGGTVEEILGFRLRLRDGAVEYYRQEEAVEVEKSQRKSCYNPDDTL